MKLKYDFSKLDQLLKSMGGTETPRKLDGGKLPPLAVDITTTGVIIDPGNVRRGVGGELVIEGDNGESIQVVLHIKDTWDSQYVLENEPEKSRRYHVAECDTLDNMRRKRRFERYVVSRRIDGKFHVLSTEETGEHIEVEAELKVCKNCLTALNWKGYAVTKDDKVWRNFDIKEFLSEFDPKFRSLPSRKDTGELF